MLVGKKAPLFSAAAILPNSDRIEKMQLKDCFGKNGLIVVFYPKDFTFVCPTEIIAFNNRVDEFHHRGFKIAGISVDPIELHQKWINTPIKQGGIGKIGFPLFADVDKEISKSYDVLSDQKNIALRGSFLIDAKGIVRHCVINDFPLGRSIDEMLRMVDELCFVEEHGEVCPANWKAGKKAMKESEAGVIEYLNENLDDLK